MLRTTYQYIGRVDHEPGTDFGIDIPDFPGLYVAGLTLEETKVYASESLRARIKSLLEEGIDLPSPSFHYDESWTTYVVEVVL
jgi:predicted RNase H-like HicB family nuclease